MSQSQETEAAASSPVGETSIDRVSPNIVNAPPREQHDDFRQPQIVGQNAQRHQERQPPQTFDMSASAEDLAFVGQSPIMLRSPPGYPGVWPSLPMGTYSLDQLPYGRSGAYDPNSMARMQAAEQQRQQQYIMQMHYGQSGVNAMHAQTRQMHFTSSHEAAYMMADQYVYAMNAAHYSPIGPRFTMSSFPHHAETQPEQSQPNRRSSVDTGPIPAFPRGPPRKPKQSGHALWVGNLPSTATVIDLKDYFARGATQEIQSVFLISKSNCAFVNYRTEAASLSAINKFHDSRFQGVRLVCRLRRGSVPSIASAGTTDKVGTLSSIEDTATAPQFQRDNKTPVEEQFPDNSRTKQPVETGDATVPPPPTPHGAKVSEKYFIVKSLTVQDLEASVRNRVWATQSHNEETLNRAYEQADDVYLIFSANKSGEYFGYARMTSPIEGEPVNLSSSTAQRGDEPAADLSGAPQSIPTSATETAPRGRIIDDSARGTIFWEAERDENEPLPEGEEVAAEDGQNWGRQFSIEWVSTTRLPFYRTRGLRNPWNANREVKIARDGTELEPLIARRLVQMFHRSGSSVSAAIEAGSTEMPL